MANTTTTQNNIAVTDIDNVDKDDLTTQKVIKLVQGFGYPIQVFQNVETEDKYLLNVYRVPHGIANKDIGNKERPAVLLMHGFLASSLDYLLLGPKRALAYILADAGYDVWVGNYRGSEHALKHKELNANADIAYWNFSFHEIGVYDLSAMIDLILKTANCKTVSFIGTSQGTASMFVLLAEKPEYNKIMKIFICLAPVHCVSNMPSPFIYNLAIYPVIWKPLALALGWFSFPTKPMIKLLNYIADNWCQNEGIPRSILTRVMFSIFGPGYEQLDQHKYSLIINHITNATSVKHYIHFSQNAIEDKFRQFDFGAKENIKLYKQETPPTYDYSKITCPVALFHSEGDWISGKKDVEILKNKLPNVVLHKTITKEFNHMDFSFGTDVVNILYNDVRSILDQYTKQ